MRIINPGVISNFIILLILILTITDWFTPYVNTYGKRIIIIYLIASFVFFYITIPITDSWSINIGGYLFPIFIYLIILLKKVKQDILYVSSASVLLGATYFLFKELIRLDPVLLFWDELYELTLFLLVIIIVVVSKLIHRIVLLIGGLLIGELLFNIRHHDVFLNIILGDGKFRDLLWFSLFQLFIFHYVLVLAKNIVKKLGIINFAKLGDKN